MRSLLIIGFFAFCGLHASAQTALGINYAPYQFGLDFQTFFKDSDHGLELGIYVNGREQIPLITNKAYFHPAFELLYQRKLFEVGKGGVGLLGIGPRLEHYIQLDGADGGLAIPASFQWYFLDDNAMARLRLTGIVGTYLDVVPSVALSFTF